VIAANNLMTIGALRALRDGGSEVTLAGFDDIEVADLFQRPLTLVTFNADQLGERSAQVLFDRQSGPSGTDAGERRTSGSPVRDVLPTKLVSYGEPLRGR